MKRRVVVAVVLAVLAASAGHARVGDPRSDLAAIKVRLEQRLKKLSAARQRELGDVIAAQEHRIRQAEELIGILEELESRLASEKSHVALLKVEWEVAELRSNAAQSRLASATRERDADRRNIESYRQTLFRKWGCPVDVPRCEKQFTLPEEAAASEAFERDKTDYVARGQAWESKWSRYGELGAAAQQARQAADSKRIPYEQARGASDALREEIQSRGNDLRALRPAFENGWRALGDVAPTPGPGPGPESPRKPPPLGPGGRVRVPNGVDASALQRLMDVLDDEQGRINGEANFGDDCYDSGCIATNAAGVVVVPKLPPAVESRLANNPGYKAATERAAAAEKTFRDAEAKFLGAARDTSTPPELLQELYQERTAANIDRIETKIEVVTYALDLTPVPPKPGPKRPEPPSPTVGGGGNQ